MKKKLSSKEKLRKLEEDYSLPEGFFDQFKNTEDFQSFFQLLYRNGAEAMLQAEMSEFLGYEKHAVTGYNSGNSRNGSSKKTIKTATLGDVVLSIPRDRNGEFDPQLIPKHSRMSDKLEDAILGMYSRGMTTGDVSEMIADLYGVSVSSTTVSNVSNQLLKSVKEWQERPLDEVYYVVWMDGIRIKIRHNGKIVNKCVYLVIGLNKEGMKEVLGMWIDQTESASFWLKVLTDLKNRGVKDILIACTDNLAGCTQAINAAFPQAITQLCIVHQIRNSCKFVSWKERREFAKDLRTVDGAINEKSAASALDDFEKKWGINTAMHTILRRSQGGSLAPFL